MRRKKHTPPRAPRAAPKALTPAATRVRAYPDLGTLLREPSLGAVLRGAALGSVALSAVALAGCESPVCEPTRFGEFTRHGGNAVYALGRLQPVDSVTQLGIGIGVAPHSSGYSMAGEMMPVSPTPLPTAAPVSVVPAPDSLAPPSGPVVPATEE